MVNTVEGLVGQGLLSYYLFWLLVCEVSMFV